MISNPCTWFIDGYSEKQFTYEGGSTLYHLHLHTYRIINIVFLANDINHAKDVVKRMFQFRLECAKEYQNYIEKKEEFDHKHEFKSENERIIEFVEQVLGMIERGEITIDVALTNQMYIVGWAHNDTILN